MLYSIINFLDSVEVVEAKKSPEEEEDEKAQKEKESLVASFFAGGGGKKPAPKSTKVTFRSFRWICLTVGRYIFSLV